jgi:hypothetical protein
MLILVDPIPRMSQRLTIKISSFTRVYRVRPDNDGERLKMSEMCNIVAIDANGTPVKAAFVVLDNAQGTTDGKGTMADISVAANVTHILTISHPYYVTETVQFLGPIRTGTWNNSLFERTVQTDRTVITVRLGRCISAPTVLMPRSEYAKLAAIGGDPHKALLYKHPSGGLAYQYQSNAALAVQLAEEILLPDSPPPPTADGWDRFRSHISPPADIAAQGRFFWLLYPNSPQPQYAVAVWSPNIDRAKPLDKLDTIVFYSPHTAEYTATYPFGMKKGTEKAPDQQYMSLGFKYLLNYGFIYGLVARKRQAVIIMPICNHGKWGPFASGEGVFRLCREVAIFLHRENRTSNRALAIGGMSKNFWLAGGSLRDAGMLQFSADFGIPPEVGNIVISGFSTGIAPVKSIMQSWPLQGFDHLYWGCPPDRNAMEGLFKWAWRELWDMDGFHPTTGGWDAYLTLLHAWAKQTSAKGDTDRIVRLCHSENRSPRNPLTDTHAVWKYLKDEGITVQIPSPRKPPFGATELHGRRWSVVTLDTAYIETNPEKGTPSLGPDSHSNTVKVAFSHCAALSRAGVLSP